jgi:uncharacterized protein YfdQ (DUF2303 family)
MTHKLKGTIQINLEGEEEPEARDWYAILRYTPTPEQLEEILEMLKRHGQDIEAEKTEQWYYEDRNRMGRMM